MNQTKTILITGASGFLGTWRADTHKISQLGFTAKYSLNNGLKQVVNWAKINA
jgi:nucleoside-diphosphate-sugar epimerase